MAAFFRSDNNELPQYTCEKFGGDAKLSGFYHTAVIGIDSCEADFDCDLDVDADDVTAFLDDFGRSQYFEPCSNELPCNGDFDCDEDVDADDVTKFLEDFGRSQFFDPCLQCSGEPWCVYQS